MQTSAIPETLAPFFQEYHLEDLEPERATATIIERTLQFGNRAEIRWLFGQFSRAQIAAWLEENGRERLPEPHRTFWALLLKTIE